MEIKAQDSHGNPITTLTSDVIVELAYSGSQLVTAFSGITLDHIKNLQISHYDQTTFSWVPLPSSVSASSGSIFENFTGSTRLSSISGYQNVLFVIRASTDHFTLFTSLVSTAVNNSTPAASPPVVVSGGGGGGGGSSGGSGGSGGGGSSGGGSSGGGGGGGSSTVATPPATGTPPTPVPTSIVTGIVATSKNVSNYL